MPQYEIVTFGETMIRLSPPHHGKLEVAESLDFRTGGSESNTAVALSRLGRTVSWWSKLPKNPLGRKIAMNIGKWGVDTSNIIWSEKGRAGVYFVEFGSQPRPTQVYYDRAESVASTMKPTEVDWSHLDGAKHLHVTGITVALSRNCSDTVQTATYEARSRSMTVSLDVNYRSKLWSHEACRNGLMRLMPNVNLLFCPMGDANSVFGIRDSPGSTARRLSQMLKVETVIVTGNHDHVAALHNKEILRAEVVRCREVDRVGAGDAGNAGIIHGYLDGDLQKGLRYGCAMAALKQTVPGDELIVTKEEIEAIVNGGHSGIQR